MQKKNYDKWEPAWLHVSQEAEASSWAFYDKKFGRKIWNVVSLTISHHRTSTNLIHTIYGPCQGAVIYK